MRGDEKIEWVMEWKPTSRGGQRTPKRSRIHRRSSLSGAITRGETKNSPKKPQAGLHRHPDIDDDDGPMRDDERLTRTGAGEKHMAHVVEVCAECF